MAISPSGPGKPGGYAPGSTVPDSARPAKNAAGKDIARPAPRSNMRPTMRSNKRGSAR